MAIGFEDDAEPGIQESDATVASGFILSAGAYGEPVWVDTVCPAGQWVLLATRDPSRTAFVVLKTPGVSDLKVRSGTNVMAASFVAGKADNAFSLRYVDFLTIVTGEFFGLSSLGETITVGTIRLQ